MDFFSLYVLFSHLSPRNALMGIFLLFLHSCAYICTCIGLFPRVVSRVLKWGNKTYKLKRSISSRLPHNENFDILDRFFPQ